MSLTRPLLLVAVMMCATFFTRAVPFLFFSRRRPPRAIAFICEYLPPAIMTILALSSFRDVNWTTLPYGAPELLSAFVVAALHAWKHNAFLSIFGGTAFYMFITRVHVFTWLIAWIFGG